MGIKKVYFVRHGETLSNRDNIVQGLDDPLSPTGIAQAELLAKRLTNLPIDTFISSDLLRARQTSESVAKEIGMVPTYSPLFREIKRPHSLIGLHRESEAYISFLNEEKDNYEKEGWRYEDGENMADITVRAKQALSFLESQEGEDILVLTHANFLRFMGAFLLLNKEITPDAWRRLHSTLQVTNAGITIFEYSQNYWKLITWNDFAHFAE